MKRIIAALIICILVLGLVSCAEKGSDNKTQNSGSGSNKASAVKSLSLEELKGTWYSSGAAYGLRVRNSSDGWTINYFNKTEYYRAESGSAYDPASGKLTLTNSDAAKGQGTFTIVVIDKDNIRIAEDDVVLIRQP